ncbi:ProQ/FINO family protein [Leclercia adecarboxylata]|uniref:ProQ/FINO family protein n=1 Tax=Leclercia adecarboxylata TaxID=83655 RepID=UPI000E0F25CA|nr:ProQ/FINO family protein [Leclercia adecarboxylata]
MKPEARYNRRSGKTIRQHDNSRENGSRRLWRNHKQKSSRHNRKKLELLITHWPAAFNLDAPRPLAIGTAELIAADMCARGITGAGKIRAAVTMYTRRASYLKALIAGGSRYNLAGQPEGEVTPEQQHMARENLSAMNGKITVRGDHAPDA